MLAKATGRCPELQLILVLIVNEMRHLSSIIASIMLALLCAVPALATEESIVIQDSSGVPRSTSLVDGLGRVDFALVDTAGNPIDGAIVTLTNATTGETLSASTQLGLVTFDNIAPGTWTVASTTPGVTFTNVSILAVSAGAAGTTIAAGTALQVLSAGGAATAVGIGIHETTNNSGKSTTELSPFS